MPATNAEFDGQPSFSPFQSLDRPESLRPASRSVSTASLYRLAAAAGMGSALVLLVNAAKRSGIIATTDLTQLLAPLAEIMALGLVGACSWPSDGARDCSASSPFSATSSPWQAWKAWRW